MHGPGGKRVPEPPGCFSSVVAQQPHGARRPGRSVASAGRARTASRGRWWRRAERSPARADPPGPRARSARVRVARLSSARRLGAVHARHAHVGDDDVEGRPAPARRARPRRSAANTMSHSCALRAQQALQAVEDRGSSSTNRMRRCFIAAAACACRRSPSMGSRTMKVVPRPTSRLEGQRAAVLVDHDRARDGEALAGALPDLLGREERVEDRGRGSASGMPAPVSRDRDHHVVAIAARASR